MFALLLASFIGFANVTAPDTSCAITSDKYETPLRFQASTSKFASECSFTEKFRAAIILQDSPSLLTFANYLHNKEYWTLTVPKNIEIKDVFFQIEKFSVVSGIVAAHTQMRFTFKNPLQVKASSQTNETTASVADMVISFEASYPKGNSYNFAIGAFDNYALVGRITSGKQAQDESSDQVIEQYKLKLSDDEMRQLFFASIYRSHQIEQRFYYNTLRPNCTTEVFDLLDALPSLKGKFSPFLTVISNDPIAAPSVDALKERQILDRRWANYRDEIESGSTQAPSDTTNADDTKLLEEIDGRPYSLVLFTPSDVGQSKEEKLLIEKAKAMVYEAMPTVLQSMGSAFLMNENKQAVLLSVLSQYTKELKAKLKELTPLLGNTEHNVSLYFVPWNTNYGKRIDFKVLKAPARLPFEIYEITNEEPKKFREAMYFVTDGTRLVQDRSYNDPNKKMFFMGAGVTIHLNKRNPNIAIQAFTGLNPQSLPQDVKNEQVTISSLQIPRVDSRAERPTFLLTIRQDIISEEPQTKIEFGAEGGLSGSEDIYGEFQIFTSQQNCELQKKSAPVFVGQLAEKATGNRVIDYPLKGKNVSFILRSLQFDVKQTKVESMDLVVATWPISCMSNGGINQQFTDNVNLMIADKFSSMQREDGVVSTLLDLILQ